MLQILIGGLSGIFSGIGMGGGTILIFLLTTFAGLEQHIAQANYKNKNIDVKLATYISGCGIIGAIIGSIISVNIQVGTLRKLFGIFLIAIAIHEVYTLWKEKNAHKNQTSAYKK